MIFSLTRSNLLTQLALLNHSTGLADLIEIPDDFLKLLREIVQSEHVYGNCYSGTGNLKKACPAGNWMLWEQGLL